MQGRPPRTTAAMPQALLLGETLARASALQPPAVTPRMPRVVPLPRRLHPREPDAMTGTATATVLLLHPPRGNADEAVFDDALSADPDDDEPLGAEPAPSSTQAMPATPAAADDATLAAWIARIVHQDSKALEALYDHTAARVHGFVLRIVGNAAAAEEAVEDTYWQVWRQAPRFDTARGRPLSWLLAIARSRAIDTLRREQRFQHDELPDDHSLASTAPGAIAAAGNEAPLAAAQDHVALHAALVLLPARERQLVSLAFLRGLTHEEIAAAMALPLGTVKSLIRRALLQLRTHLEPHHVGA
jgi:RNA polymerase sigma factor (sigma-70 family)